MFTSIDQSVLQQWLQSFAGALLFIPPNALWVMLLLPGVWASMLAGALYGTAWGSVIVFIGACLGAEASFLLGRTLAARLGPVAFGVFTQVAGD
jgi:uncharacterized membrane protein YdjX (TVP38/TMEM64 family)